MKNIHRLPEIARLAKRFGNELIDAEFLGDGITFRYKVGETISSYHYNDPDRGFEEEIIRLERLLALALQ